MITRYNYNWSEPVLISCPVRVEYELVKIIEPISFNDDKSIKEYKEKMQYVKHETLWSDFIKSFDLGSVQEQVMNHLQKGTPFVTAHTLPPGDYTKDNLLKGAEVLRMMRSQGVSLEMLEEIINSSKEKSNSTETNVKESEVK